MKNQLLYKDLAKYYELIYWNKNYKDETKRLKKLILQYKKSDGKDLLEVACGTGKYIYYLKPPFNCMGVDINEGMLKVARKNVKGVEFEKADMTKLNLGKQFDVILCLFSSIGYVKTYNNLEKTIKNFYKHLKPGGVTIIEPWFTKGAFRKKGLYLDVYDGKETKVIRLDTSKIKGNVSVLHMHYLVGENGKAIKHFVDRHELGFFEINKTLKIMKEAGFNTKYIKKGLRTKRGLYVCSKPLGK